jgi:hypothetical protein
MGRECCQCYYYKSGDEYTISQWSRGDGASRCRRCIEGYFCNICRKQFIRPEFVDKHIIEQHQRKKSVPNKPKENPKQLCVHQQMKERRLSRVVTDFTKFLRKIPK